ncbi:MAG: YqgE/AlgH family protein [Paracoccaceae bacterium]|nr:YqgE/AlgH family protein [Paracoccaceae bacterium]
MKEKPKTTNLNGKFLIAMPNMGDSRFTHAVIYICSHHEEGTMGLIINKTAINFNLSDLIKQLTLPTEIKPKTFPINIGGPVEPYRGFILHTLDYVNEENTVKVDQILGMTSTLDILEDIASSKGPETFLVALGYSGWGAGQLELEIKNNGWLVSDSNIEIIFNNNNSKKWGEALKLLGVDPILLSTNGGNA